jgi:two-component system cell cycle response regulator
MKVKILSVDDSSLIRMAIARLFSRYECEVVSAADGEKGLAAVDEHKPNVVILDYNMPVLDGIGMLRRLRDNPETKRLPVIMLTANSAPETIATVARLGVRVYITKPFDDELLVSKVAKVVSLVPKVQA